MAANTLSERITHNWKFLEHVELDLDNGWTREMVRRKWWQKAVASLIRNTDTWNLILIDQYRYPLQKRVIELVAGLTDKQWVSLEQILTEEVREETGYQNVDSVDFLTETASSAGMTDETTSIYSIEVSWEKWEQDLEPLEDIDVIEVPENELLKFLSEKSSEGRMIDPKIWMAMYMYQQKFQDIL